MRWRRAALALALLAGSGATAGAQVVIDPLAPAQSPPGVRWAVIRTPHFEVIFPREMEAGAQRVANTLEHVRTAVGRTLRTAPRPLSVVLHNQGTGANGFVTLGPRRTEWFTTPPQAADLLGANSWLDLLAVHEYRHVAQFELSNRGLTRLAYYLFGETGWQLLTGLSVPSWFFEGDAVGIETALTSSGRGRLGEFDQALRAIRAGGRRDGYWKALHGSYADFVPNAYVMGYAITTHVRRRYGADAWRRVLARNANLALLPNAFSIAMHQVLGKGAPGIYADAMAELDSIHRARAAGRPTTPAQRLTRPTRGAWTSDMRPQMAADGSIIALRGGYEDIPHFVRLDPASGRAEHLVHSGQRGLGEPFGVGGTLLAWNETRYDPRWGRRDWSVVRTHDLRSGTTRTLRDRTRWFAPAVSARGDRIVVVEVGHDGRSALVVVDAAAGAEQARIPFPVGTAVQTPRWSPDGRTIVFAIVEQGRGRAIAAADVESREVRVIVPHSAASVATPATDGRHVYFAASRGGRDEIHATPLGGGPVWRVTNRPVGATAPALSPDGRTLLFAEATPHGIAAHRMPIDTTAWVAVEPGADAPAAYVDPLVDQEGAGDILSGVPDARYPVRPYRPLGHAFDVFGWTAWADPDEQLAGVALYSRDKLGTLATSVGWAYNRYERTHGGFATASYGGLWPMLDVGASHGDRSPTYIDTAGVERRQSWRETAATVGVRVPLNLTRGLFGTALRLGAEASLVRISGQEVGFLGDNGNGDFIPVSYEAALARGYRGVRDINPVWGGSGSVRYGHTPGGGDYSGRQLSAQSFLYAPGARPHHSAWLYLAHERQDPGNYVFSRRVRFPRGYSARTHRRFYEASGNYTLPLAYPDLNILKTLHLTRLRGTAFYDWAEGSGAPVRHYRSFGGEMGADLFLFSYPIPFFGGVRVARLVDEGRTVVEPVLGIPF